MPNDAARQTTGTLLTFVVSSACSFQQTHDRASQLLPVSLGICVAYDTPDEAYSVQQ